MKRIGETDQQYSERLSQMWTPERRAAQRARMSGAANPLTGTKHTEEWKQAASKRMSGDKNPFAGKSHPPEKLKQIRAGISKALKGRAPRLYRYGITDEEYARQMAAGNVWCCGERKHFVPKEQIQQMGTIGGLCGDCGTAYRRRRKLDREYGVTPEWFDEQMKKQGGCCALCGNSTNRERGDKEFNLCVDHDHVTNKPRGILCRRCNSSLERAEKVPGWIEKALAYLKSYAASPA